MGSICSSSPLVKPLIKFHNMTSSSFDKLPCQGKALEIAKRVVIITVAPFAYLALGLLALTGLALNCFFKNRDVKNISNDSPESKKPLFSVASECDKLKEKIIFTVNAAKEISQLQSAKILLDIECEDKKFSKDYVIKKLDLSLFDEVFIAGILDTILSEAKEFFQIQNAEKLKFKWIAFLKDKDGVFSEADGSRDCSNDQGEYRFRESEGKGKIDSNDLEKYFNLVLKSMQREIRPQLDHQLNFV